MKRADFNLEDRIGRHLGMTAKAWKLYANQKLAESGYDLTIEQAVIIAHAWHHDGLNQQQISEMIDRDKTSTTRIIDILEKEKLVKRVHDNKDRRQNLIRLTEKGESKCREFINMAREIEHELIQGIDRSDIKICKKVLSKIRQNISDRQKVLN